MALKRLENVRGTIFACAECGWLIEDEIVYGRENIKYCSTKCKVKAEIKAYADKDSSKQKEG